MVCSVSGMAWIIFAYAIPYPTLPLPFTRRCFFQDKLAERQRLDFLCTGLAPFACLLRHRWPTQPLQYRERRSPPGQTAMLQHGCRLLRARKHSGSVHHSISPLCNRYKQCVCGADLTCLATVGISLEQNKTPSLFPTGSTRRRRCALRQKVDTLAAAYSSGDSLHHIPCRR